MSTTKAILQQVQTVLKADATLSAYVGTRVHLGLRRNVGELDFPVIFLEPDVIAEDYPAYPKVDANLSILLAAYTRSFDLDSQLVGDANYKGVLDLEKDIKAALGATYPTLNGTVIEFTFPRTEFGVREDLAQFPVRGITIQVDLHYRTQLDTRT